jgi:hypothetical protein
MPFQELVTASQKYFPSLQVRYKDRSNFMKFLGTVMFFNKKFMSSYTINIGNIIYLPNCHFTKSHPVSGSVSFLHELIHLYDQKRLGNIGFRLSYLFPQILSLLSLLLFLVSWKIALPIFLLFLLPIPAYFRMKYEKRAYLSSLYVIQKLSKSKVHFTAHLDIHSRYFIKSFIDSTYYFMWPFKKYLRQEFKRAIELIEAGQRPYQDPVFDMIDDLIGKV